MTADAPQTTNAAGSPTAQGVTFSHEEVHLFRQWFESAQDCNPSYLEAKDYRLAVHVYQVLGWPVSQRVREGSEG